MEKPGSGNVASGSSGLLKVLLFAAVCLCAPLRSDSQETGARFSIALSSREIHVGDEVTVLLSVFDALPANVSINTQTEGTGLRLVHTRKELVQTTFSPSTLFTLEYRALLPGTQTLSPIVIMVNGNEQFVTKAETIQVFGSQTAVQDKAGLRWMIASSPERASVGEAFVIVLEGYHPGERKSLNIGFPENALLESVPLPDGYTAEQPWKALLAKKVTALSEGLLSLPSAVLSYSGQGGDDTAFISSPETRIEVSRILHKTSKDVSDSSTVDNQTLERAFTVQEPSGDEVKAYDPEVIWRAVYEGRKNEYESLFRQKARERRLALESQYGLLPSLSVPPGAWKALSVILAVCVFILSIFLRFPFFNTERIRRLSAVLFLMGLLLSAWSIYVYILDRYPAAVVSGVSVYHVPEEGTTVIETLNAGAAVRILSEAGDWYYAETATGERGWLAREKTFVYTGSD